MNKLALAGACVLLSAVSAHAQYVDGLPPAASVSSSDLLPVIQGSVPVAGAGLLPGSGVARRATVGQIANAVGNSYVPYSGASSPVNLGAFPLTLGVASAPAAPGAGGALYVDGSGVLHFLTGSGDTPFVGKGAHVRLNVMSFGAKMDGTTQDASAFNAARGAAGTNGTIYVPPGGFVVSPVPTAGPSTPVLWELSGNAYGTGSTSVAGLGSDTVESYFGGSKYIGRQANATANAPPVAWVANTITTGGGTVGNVAPALKVEEVVNSGAGVVNNFPWAISAAVTMNATGPAQAVAVSGYAIRNTANPGGGGLWGFGGGATDTSGLKTTLSGGANGMEVDVNANDIDDGGSFAGITPWGGRTGILVVTGKGVAGGATAQIAHGILIGNGDTSKAVIGSVFQPIGGYYQAVLDDRAGTKMTGAHTIWLNTADDIAFDYAGTHTLNLASATGPLNYTVGGVTELSLQDNGLLQLTGGEKILGASGIGVALSVSSNAATGVDTAAGTFSGSAIRLAAGQNIGLDVASATKISSDGATITLTGNAKTTGAMILAQTTVAALPTCNAALKGGLMGVTDATSPTYNGTITGGGTVAVPVYCNGSAWTAH